MGKHVKVKSEVKKTAKKAAKAVSDSKRYRVAYEGNVLVDSTSDDRTVNNVMRHQYKVLSDDEKIAMQKVKDDGLKLWEYFDSLGISKELSVAKTNLEQSVMWAVKHITG